MCGICGQFNFRHQQKISPADVRAMASAIRHRGPDDEGFYVSGPIGLGFRRLSIIDLTCGHQPMSDADQSVWVVFNGEIYNFKELRAELESFGHVFRTKSDTEVIVYGYKQWGEDVLSHLNGMFALALWDPAQRKLMLARDAMGIKPLYYQLDSSTVTFSSEIRGLLARADKSPEIDPAALALFLQHRYVPAPYSLIKNVRKLAAGTRLIAQSGSEPRLERWWNFSPAPFDSMPNEDEATEHLLMLYKQAVKRQLVSDVPLGLLLSGGLDSGLLLALMKENGRAWNTYTVGYGNSYADDELSDAEFTASHFGVPNFQVRLSRETFESTLESVADILEEPVTASSVVPMYHLCQRARRDVKVVLMGQGPDELLGGYTRHLGAKYGYMWRALPHGLRQLAGFGMQKLTRWEMVKRALQSLDVKDRWERYERILSLDTHENICGLFKRDVLVAGQAAMRQLWKKEFEHLMSNTDELGGLQFLEMRSSLPDELLMYADKISMAHGLEVRVPYLDQDIVQFVERLNSSFKVRRGSRKWLHRKVTKLFLPPQVLRRKKRGFLSDIDGWFRQSVSTKMGDVLRDRTSLLYEYVRWSAVKKLHEDHQSGTKEVSKILFSLVMLEQTLRVYSGSSCANKHY